MSVCVCSTMADSGVAFAVFFSLYFGLPALFLIIYLLKRIVVIERGTAMVVERWGRFHRCCYAGWHLMIPFADRARGVLWRTTELNRRTFVRRLASSLSSYRSVHDSFVCCGCRRSTRR